MHPGSEQKTEYHSTGSLIFVLLMVLLICGGNAVGILTGVLLWKLKGQMVPAVLAAVIITVIFFSLAMVMIALHHRELAAQEKRRRQEQASADNGPPPTGD